MMKSLKIQRIAVAIFVLLLSALALAAGGYHQIEKYGFPAAQGSTNILITSPLTLHRAAFFSRTALRSL